MKKKMENEGGRFSYRTGLRAQVAGFSNVGKAK